LQSFADAISSAIGSKDFAKHLLRIPLLMGFLERYPRDERARDYLSDLVQDCLATHQEHKAMAAIDRFGPLTGLPDHELDVQRMQAARTDAERIPICRRILASPAAADTRVWVSMELARDLQRVGQRDEALVTIDAWMREFASSQLSRNYLEDAQKMRKE